MSDFKVMTYFEVRDGYRGLDIPQLTVKLESSYLQEAIQFVQYPSFCLPLKIFASDTTLLLDQQPATLAVGEQSPQV